MALQQITDEQYEELLKKYEYKFQKGDLVQGTVCGMTAKALLLI